MGGGGVDQTVSYRGMLPHIQVSSIKTPKKLPDVNDDDSWKWKNSYLTHSYGTSLKQPYIFEKGGIEVLENFE